MRLLLPLLTLAAAACADFGGSTKTSEDEDKTASDAGVLAEVQIHAADGSIDAGAPDPCAGSHVYCNDFEGKSLESGFSGQPDIAQAPDASPPAAALVPLPTGGQAGSFSLGALVASQFSKYRIGHFVTGSRDGKIRVSMDMKLVVTDDWPVHAQLPFFVVSLPTAADSGLFTLAMNSDRKVTVFRQASSSSPDGTPVPTLPSTPIAWNEWFHLDIAIGDKLTITISRAGAATTPVDAPNDILMNGKPPSIILGPAHYAGQGDLPNVDVLYDNVVVDDL